MITLLGHGPFFRKITRAAMIEKVISSSTFIEDIILRSPFVSILESFQKLLLFPRSILQLFRRFGFLMYV